jgi:hypothetical protein
MAETSATREPHGTQKKILGQGPGPQGLEPKWHGHHPCLTFTLGVCRHRWFLSRKKERETKDGKIYRLIERHLSSHERWGRRKPAPTEPWKTIRLAINGIVSSLLNPILEDSVLNKDKFQTILSARLSHAHITKEIILS